jgi:hypothetical protein
MKTALLLICLSLSIISFSQNRITDTSATCISFWQNKETRVYQVKHSKEKFDALSRRSLSEGNYEAQIKIIDSTATGFTIEWIYKNFEISGAPENVLNSLFTIMEGLKIVYKTDDVGTFTELVNWEEVRDFALARYEKAVAKNSHTKEFIAALNQIKSIFQSKENIEAVLIKEIQLFHTPFGVEYTKTGSIIETDLPNITGGDPFPSTITIKLDELDQKKDLIRVSLNQTIDKEKAGPIIAEILKKISSSPIKDETELKRQIKDMEITDLSEYSYAISSGWITRVLYKRTSNIGAIKAVETYLITQKK